MLVAWLTAQTRGTSNELVNSILPAQAQAYRLQGALVDQETGVRGYGLTGDVRFLQPYTAGLATEKAAAAQLRALIGGKKPLTADLARIERAARAWRAGYAVPSINQARRGPLTGNDLTLLDQGKNAFDRLRVLFATQNAHLSAATRGRPGRPRPGPGLPELGLRRHPGGLPARRGGPGGPAGPHRHPAAAPPARGLRRGGGR